MRSYVVSTLFLLGLCAVLFRIVQIQTGDTEKYEELTHKINFRTTQVQGAKGNLYTSDGVLLATTTTRYDVFIDFKTIKSSVFDEQVDDLADSLHRLFPVKSVSYYKNLLKKEKRKDNQYYPLYKNLNFDDFARLKSFPIFNLGQNRGGFIVEKKEKREKPVSGFGNRTLGFDDEKGKAGLEGAFSDYLQGEILSRVEKKIRSNLWKPVSFGLNEQLDPQEGFDVYATIDMRIQDICYTALKKQLEEYQADHGCVVVMEVETGKVLAMSNLKRNGYGAYSDVRNYAVWEASEPGSTFKVMSLLCALDDGYIQPNDVIEINGNTWTVYGQNVVDDHASDRLTITQILTESSNIGAAKIINTYYRKNPEAVLKKFQDWNLTVKTGIEIPGESEPYFPSTKDLKQSRTTLPWMSFGYNIKLTPLQTLAFYNALANNGTYVQPQLLERIERDGIVEKEYKTKVVAKNIANKKARSMMIDMLTSAVEKGTAASIFTPNLKMAGKTGTTQLEYWLNKPVQYQSSFCGFFPADNPKYSCIVMIHKPNKEIGFYGSEVAAPVFKEVAGKVFLKSPLNIPTDVKSLPTYNINKQLNTHKVPKVKKDQQTIPNVVGYYGEDAIPVLENIGLKVRYKGNGKVLEQSLAPGMRFKKGATIYLNLQ